MRPALLRPAPVSRRRSRSAYSVGLTTSRVSQAVPRFDPLYSLAAIRASVACGAAGRRVNRVHFDLMNRFDATLASFPFWEGGWAPELGASVRPFRRGHKPRFVDFPEDPVPLWPGERRPPSADQLATIRRTRANAWQVVHLAETQRMCQELLPEARDLAAGFDPLMLKRLFAREPAHRSHYRLLHQLASVLAWYCSGEGQA